MFSDTKLYKILAVLGILAIILILIFVACTSNEQNETNPIVMVPTATPVPSEVPVSTNRPPIYVIRVTPTPKPTEVPTTAPTEEPTEAPTAEPTPKPTEAPTAEPTEKPTEAPTAEPTEEPTEAPTIAPTEEPTEAPTTTPTEKPPVFVVPTINAEAQYVQIEKEMDTLTMAGGIYPNYNVDITRDLYNYISVDGLEEAKLFAILKKPFMSGISAWTSMKFDTSKIGCEQLEFALETSICNVCGKVVIEEHPENSVAISELFDAIERIGDFSNANQLMLNYLENYTVRNPDNPNERWVISCKGH